MSAGPPDSRSLPSRRSVLHLLAGLPLLPGLASAVRAGEGAPEPVETPYFAGQVAEGKLPKVADRLPKTPRIVDLPAMQREIGRPGGTWRMLMGDQRDLRMMTVYSYARLVGLSPSLDIVPDILERLDVEDGRTFTLHLREGHRWSDGEPFTAEDFRYYFEDVANNPQLSPSGLNLALLANGKPPKFEVLDPRTVRYAWEDPNPGFVPALAGAQPLFIFMPFHYMKKYHPRYAAKDKLEALVKKARVVDWSALHERKGRQYRPENPDLPTLDPWWNRTAPPAQQFVFERNPFFHRVDTAGHQLPYIDTAEITIATTHLIPAKVASGEANLQARYLNFEDYTFLKAAEGQNHYQTRLWQLGQGAYAALYPNFTCADAGWRAVLRDKRVRRALSLGINRRDINRVIFFGLARESANTVLPESPLYRPELASAWTGHDVAEANRLLDEAGLNRRDHDGTRFLPDGRRAEITVETAGDNPIFADILELVASDWAQLGLRTFSHPSHLDIFRKRIVNGQTIMAIATGFDNGVPTADFEPEDLAPVREAQYQWSRWGLNYESQGHQGEPVDMPEFQSLLDLYRAWRHAATEDEKRSIWTKMLDINAELVVTIGIVNSARQPVVVGRALRNVPDSALFSFEPGSFFGIYMPDTFWFDDVAQS